MNQDPDPFIVEFKDTLTPELCEKIIRRYEDEKDKHAGVTSSGLNTAIKDSTDYRIRLNTNSELWKDVDVELYNILKIYLVQYIDSLNRQFYPDDDYRFFKKHILSENGFQLQKYTKNTGKFVYHHDFSADYQRYRHRVIVYLWYLNTVDEGGETEFLGGKYSVRPERGKLILFPATWTYPHMGKMPISDDKYIITGWFYVEDNNTIHDILHDKAPSDIYTVLDDTMHKTVSVDESEDEKIDR
jgi:hypothetical protein